MINNTTKPPGGLIIHYIRTCNEKRMVTIAAFSNDKSFNSHILTDITKFLLKICLFDYTYSVERNGLRAKVKNFNP